MFHDFYDVVIIVIKNAAIYILKGQIKEKQVQMSIIMSLNQNLIKYLKVIRAQTLSTFNVIYDTYPFNFSTYIHLNSLLIKSDK